MANPLILSTRRRELMIQLGRDKRRQDRKDEAEVVIDGIPGKIFQGKVTAVIPAIAAGNVQANAGLLDQTSAVRPGRLPVLISITDPEWAKYQVIAGASGQAAIYTKHFHHVSVMRKVLLRMTSWVHYLYLDH